MTFFGEFYLSKDKRVIWFGHQGGFLFRCRTRDMLSVINESVARGPLFVKKFMDIEIEECIERVRKEREASRNSGGGGHHRGPIEATKETEKRKE